MDEKKEKRILVPTDGSEDMEAVLKMAVDIAHSINARIYVMYVVDLTPFIDFPEDEQVQLLRAKLYEEGWNALHNTEKIARALGAEVELIIEEGNPAEKIIKKAKRLKVDLIVMGTRHEGIERYIPAYTTSDKLKEIAGRIGAELTRTLFGSVADKVIKSAPCDVLAVPLLTKEEM
jgi:nucleotide-binding universal stress UspA family protein